MMDTITRSEWALATLTRIWGLVTLFLLLAAPIHAAPNILIDEQFSSLAQWEPFTFPKIDNHSSYAVTIEDGVSCLVATTRNSASAILYKEQFNVYDYPEIAWRWKVSNVYKKGDSSRKDGDDYPVRLYILFQYDSETASFGKMLRYEAAKLLYGSYPPDSSLNYIWANKKQGPPYIPNPFTSRAMMFPVDRGSATVGSWSEHRRNIVKDYTIAFGKAPPSLAALAVMSDSDNTGESATAYIDYIRVSREP